jgi:hypothetical protein
VQDEDTANRLAMAESAYENGLYGAAIYDAVYVIEAVRADTENADAGQVELLVNENRSSLWGRVYQSHAAFLYTQNQTQGAYRTALFARGLDNATAEMRTGLRYAQNASTGGESGNAGDEGGQGVPGESNMLPLLMAAVISIFLFLVLLLLLTRRTYGDNGTGPRKADRAKQKKG